MFNNYDTLLIFDEDNRYYFSGFRSSFGCVILSAKKKVLITDSRYDGEARKKAVDFVVIQASASNMYQVILKQLELAKSKVVGFENDSMTVSDFNELKKNLSDYTLVPASGPAIPLKWSTSEPHRNCLRCVPPTGPRFR